MSNDNNDEDNDQNQTRLDSVSSKELKSTENVEPENSNEYCRSLFRPNDGWEIVIDDEEQDDDDGGVGYYCDEDDVEPDTDPIVCTPDELSPSLAARFGPEATADSLVLVACCLHATACEWLIRVMKYYDESQIHYAKKIKVKSIAGNPKLEECRTHYIKAVDALRRVAPACQCISGRLAAPARSMLQELTGKISEAAQDLLNTEPIVGAALPEDLERIKEQLDVMKRFRKRVDQTIGMKLAKQITREMVCASSADSGERLRLVRLVLMQEITDSLGVAVSKEFRGMAPALAAFSQLWECRINGEWMDLDVFDGLGSQETLMKRLNALSKFCEGRIYQIRKRRKHGDLNAAWKIDYVGSALILDQPFSS